MSRLYSLVYLLPQLWRTLLARQITVRYPFGPLDLPSYYRGRVVIEPDLCRGCGLCVRDCPAFALELQRGDRGAFRLIYHPDRCAYCGQCEDGCPTKAILLTNAFVPPAPCRDALAEVMVER